MNFESSNFLYLNLTFRCNHRCVFCVSNETVDFRGKQTSPDLSVESIMSTIAKLPPDVDTVHVSGGEPTLHKDFFDILALLKKRFSRIQIASNGVAFADQAFLTKVLDLCSPQLIIPVFTLDSQIHQRLTGANTLETIISGL